MRLARDARLETRSARVKLPVSRIPYFRSIRRGLCIGYRKGRTGGRWVVRLVLNGNTRVFTLGSADDRQDADGKQVLDYAQATKEAHAWAERQCKGEPEPPTEGYTVGTAAADYLEWYEVHHREAKRVAYTIDGDILKKFKNRQVASLTTAELNKWLRDLAAKEPRHGAPCDDPAEKARRRRASANRILTVFKAMLNHAWRNGHVPLDTAWRRVKPFRSVDCPRERTLAVKDAAKLIAACDPDFKGLVRAALYTGCRYGELCRLEIEDINLAAKTVHIRVTKSGKPRYVPITDEGVIFFRQEIGERKTGFLFVRNDQSSWGRGHQFRRMQEACDAAGIARCSFHDLRRTYGALLAMAGVPLQVIATALGHSDTRICEKHYAHLLPNYVADTIRAKLPSFNVELADVVEIPVVATGTEN